MNTPNDNYTFNALTGDANRRKAEATQPQPPLYDHASALVRILELQAQRDELLVACKPFAYAPFDIDNKEPDQLVLKVGDWEVYTKDLLALRAAIARATEGGQQTNE